MDVSAANWSTISSLLDEALDFEPAARTAWLARVETTHPDLAPTLRKLLSAHATGETADVFAHPPVLPNLTAEDVPADDGLRVGVRVGPYRLLRELGTGGMADVWLAERTDGTLSRAVALKLPRLGLL